MFTSSQYDEELASEIDNPDKVDFIYCPTEQLDALEGIKFDVAVNISSMQEMNNLTVNRYFEFLRDHLEEQNLFYCCNRESKTLPDGEVLEFAKFHWRETDRFLMDGDCPWNRYLFSVRRSSRGPRMLGLRFPIVQYYGGNVKHRLAVLSVN